MDADAKTRWSLLDVLLQKLWSFSGDGMFGVDPASDGGEGLANDLEGVSDCIVEWGFGVLLALKKVVSKGVNGGTTATSGVGV